MEPQPAWIVRLLHRMWQPAFLFPVAVALGAIVTWPYLPAWEPDLSADATYQLTADRLLLPARHRWIPADLAERLIARATEDVTASGRHSTVLLSGLSQRLYTAAAQEPWVREVRSVQVQRDGSIHFDLDFRRPVLMVATPRGMYAVDIEGVLLPPEDFTANDVQQFPVARLGRMPPLVGAGMVWGDADLEGAARLAAVLAPEGGPQDPWHRLGLAAIELPSHVTQDMRATLPEPDACYQLITRGGSRILWGRAPGTTTLEPPAEQKLARLQYYLDQCGSFETSQGPSRIDIRDIDVIYSGSLSEGRR